MCIHLPRPRRDQTWPGTEGAGWVDPKTKLPHSYPNHPAGWLASLSDNRCPSPRRLWSSRTPASSRTDCNQCMTQIQGLRLRRHWCLHFATAVVSWVPSGSWGSVRQRWGGVREPSGLPKQCETCENDFFR